MSVPAPDSAARRAQGAPPSRPPQGASLPARRLVNWVRNEALPFWSAKGWDARRGGFHERFFFDGHADDLTLRHARVQWRHIYVLAQAGDLGWFNGLKQAFKGLEYMLEKAWAPDGAPGFAHILAPDGSVAEARRDPDDHAFAIMALSWLAKATGDAQVRALLDLVMNFYESTLTDAAGFLREPEEEGIARRQAPYMQMLEAMLAAVEAVQHPEAPARAMRYRRMLEAHFIDQDSGLLVAQFDADWQPVRQHGAALVEPGHMAEWAWLIRRHERLFGQKASPLATHLLGAALRASDPHSGFLVDAIDTGQKVQLASRRLWPQTELIRAWLAQAETGAARAEESAETLIEAVLATYLAGPFQGAWFDKFDAAGQVSIDTVPAGTLYHLFGAAIEAERVLGI